MSESGIGIQSPLFFVGVVEGNVDPRLEGRVQIRAFNVHGTVHQIASQDLPWAPVLNGIIPPLNAWVIGLFVDGRDAQQPIVIGVIPTQMNVEVDPETTGWGIIAANDHGLLSQGSRSSDFGQPSISRLARGEYIEDTYVPSLEATRETAVPVAGSNETWDEPGAAYSAKYPFNKVMETAAGHSIEVDDTPGSERIMVYHRSGSYVQIDSRGTTTHKSVSDRFDVNEANLHVFVGGSAKVTVEQDAHLLVGGHMYQEVMGDMSLSVHGNFELAAGGTLNMYGGDAAQLSGSRVAISSTVADIDVLAASQVKITGSDRVDVKAGGAMNLTGGGKVSLKGGGVLAMDGSEIRALEGASTDAAAAGGTVLPPPISGASFNTSMRYSAIGTTNVYSVDDGQDGTSNYEQFDEISLEGSPDLYDFIKRYEGRVMLRAEWDYQQYSIGYGTKARHENEVITIEEAERRFREDVGQRRAFVVRYSISRNRNWNNTQIDALTSFSYNGGTGWIDQVTAQNTRTDDVIAQMMLEYNKAGGKVERGLVSRRQAESAWFRRGMAEKGDVSV